MDSGNDGFVTRERLTERKLELEASIAQSKATLQALGGALQQVELFLQETAVSEEKRYAEVT